MAAKTGQLPLPANGRGLSRRLQGLPGRSRSARRASALAVRLHLGQSRILLAGPAEHPTGRRKTSAAWSDGQGRRQPGMVRIHSRAREGAERIARHVRHGGREECADRKVGRQLPRDRTQQSQGHQQPDRLSDVSLRPPPRSDSHRPAQLLRRRPDRCGRRRQDLRSGVQRDVL